MQMGKILLKMSAIKLESNSEVQEESKISDESDISNFKITYQHSFYA